MLIALLVFLLSGGSSGTSPMIAYVDQAREHAKKEFTVEAQRKAVLDTLDDMKKVQGEFIEVEEKAAKTLIKLAVNRDSKPADFQPTIVALRTDAMETQEKLIRLRFRLKSQMTREQWAAVHQLADH